MSARAFALVAVVALMPLSAAPGQDYRDTEIRYPPKTPLGERVTALIGIINRADRDAIRAFVKDGFTEGLLRQVSADQHVAVLYDLAQRTRGYEYHSIRVYDPPRAEPGTVVIVRSRLTGAWEAIVLDVESAPPHRISLLAFAPARRPSDLPPEESMRVEDAVKELDSFVARLVEADAFCGAVLLARDGNVLYCKAFGLANRGDEVPNTIKTKFNLGSMNKMFTAVAVAQLVERGKLAYDDPVSKHLDTDWLRDDTARKATISQLLSHTSGLGSYFNDAFMRGSRELYRNVGDFRPLIADEVPQFAPGAGWAYSNSGFMLLGAMIEKVTGQSYYDYVRENIHKPCGMLDTDCYEMDRPVRSLAIGYSREFDASGNVVWTSNLFKHVIRGGPAGGGFSTVNDLLRFAEALRGDKLLTPASRELLWTPKPNSPGYGYGFSLGKGPAGRKVGHGGGFPGISSNLDIFLDNGFTAVVLSNYDQAAPPVAQKIEELIARIR